MSSAGPLSSPPAPAVTDATACTEAELFEAIAHFLPEEPKDLVFTRASGGVNNKCYFVKAPSGVEYVLRVYNNGHNTPRVAYEHYVLQALAQKQFAFEIPRLMPLRDAQAAASGATSALLSSGASACLFPRIRGVVADTTSNAVAAAIGKATAELIRGMEDLTIPLKLTNPLYRNMYDAHHAVTREGFYELIRGPRCDHVRQAADALLKELDLVEELIKKILKMEPPLPQQQIHADFHVSNVLIDPDTNAVSAVLDFEFCAPDWRAMELVVGLSKYIATAGAEEAFQAYVQGFISGGGELTVEEAELVPELIIVRILNNVIYFAGRAICGEDDLAALTTRMDMYAGRCAWIREKAPWMRKQLATAVKKAAN